MKVTILGSGSSGGVPRIGGEWGACDPAEPRNRRLRCSILVEHEGTQVLVDTSPDCRQQLLDAGVSRLDGVICTHEHADQAHGIDELRVVALNMREKIDFRAERRTLDVLEQRFSYIFRQAPDSLYPAIARATEITAGTAFRMGAIETLPFRQEHGDIDSTGLRFGPVGYANDVSALPEAAFAALAGVEILIVDALRHRPHPSHAHVEQALEWIDRIGPRRAVLTNMHVDLDYRTLAAGLPDGVEPAWDGMVLEA